MKKIMVVVLALALVLSMGVLVSAAEGKLSGGKTVSNTVPVRAEVGKYAQVLKVEGGGLEFIFQGKADETITESTSVSIESNCDINVHLSATPLAQGDDTIAVDYDFGGVNFKAGQPASFTRDGAAYDDYTLSGTAKLGAISAQAAGAYSAIVTITVSAL